MLADPVLRTILLPLLAGAAIMQFTGIGAIRSISPRSTGRGPTTAKFQSAIISRG
jgi:hypothetical protein